MSRRVAVRWGSAHVEASVTFRGGVLSLEREGGALAAAFTRDGAWITLTVDGIVHRVASARDARGLWIAWRGRTFLLVPEGREGAGRGAPDVPDEIRAPMTGRVVSVTAAPGGVAREGDLLLTIEAMKMEFRLTAPEDGTVLDVACGEGDLVELGQLLVKLKPAAAEGDSA